MASSEQDREQELAELLREVRALRQTIDELKAGPGAARLAPGYEVLVRAQQPPAAALRPQSLPPDYAVLVRAQLPIPQVLVTPVLHEPPSYEVLVRPPFPQAEEPPVER